jgi:hypothetical protein
VRVAPPGHAHFRRVHGSILTGKRLPRCYIGDADRRDMLSRSQVARHVQTKCNLLGVQGFLRSVASQTQHESAT